ncbi:hypothetical protein NDU88_002565 [Pleurodeles waltl]|uniref:Uncharacterized protein n=1 Tax=Pleurodeles waltl TaxID=8319 RepID=A0AAV7UW40_PLEWA|nr:hypothetical protein NDU88_002565 [Pleurodeles waltl]
MIHFGPILAGPLLYCSPAIACPVQRERGSRRDAPGVRAIPPCFSQVFGLSAPGFELSRARVQRLPPSWFSMSSGETAILFLPEFTPRLSDGTPLTGAYLDDHFRGLEVLLFRPGPVYRTGALS